MTDDDRELIQTLLSEVAALRKEVAPISMALNYKMTARKKEESIQDIANSIITQSILKGKGSRKVN